MLNSYLLTNAHVKLYKSSFKNMDSYSKATKWEKIIIFYNCDRKLVWVFYFYDKPYIPSDI